VRSRVIADDVPGAEQSEALDVLAGPAQPASAEALPPGRRSKSPRLLSNRYTLLDRVIIELVEEVRRLRQIVAGGPPNEHEPLEHGPEPA
jgi:hypothetical protein